MKEELGGGRKGAIMPKKFASDSMGGPWRQTDHLTMGYGARRVRAVEEQVNMEG